MVLEVEKRALLTIEEGKADTGFQSRNSLFVVDKKKNFKFGLRIITTKKLGNAVIRNSIRRRIKEAFRLVFKTLKPKVDIVIIPKAAALTAPFENLKKELSKTIEAC